MERGKRKKKPKYSLAQNLAYYFGALRKFNGRVIYMVVFGILFGALGTWLTMYIPKLILDRLEYSDGFTEIFFVIAGIFVANLLCNLVCDGIDAQKRYYNSDTWAYFNSLFEKKRLTIDYEYLQDPNIQIMKGKAWEAVSNSYSLTSIFPTTLANLGFNFICFILFGGVLGALNPLIILVLVAACVISYLPQKRLLAYMHGIKDASEAQARRLYYYSSLCRNFKIAKDVRLYAMSGWINRASAAAVRGYKRILLARENRRFAASAAEYGVALLRDGAAYAYLIWRAVSGDISAGDFVLYFSAISGFNSWFSGILDHWSSVQLTSLQICDLREYLEIKDKFNHGPGVPPPPKGEPVEIRLENVGYTYPEAEAPALKNINLTIRGGEKLAVVGLNGAGPRS